MGSASKSLSGLGPRNPVSRHFGGQCHPLIAGDPATMRTSEATASLAQVLRTHGQRVTREKMPVHGTAPRMWRDRTRVDIGDANDPP